MHSNNLTGASYKPARRFYLLMSLIALSSAGKHPGCQCCLSVCRAAATLMVCVGKFEHPLHVFQQSDRCVLRAHKNVSDSSQLCLQGSRS